jgi:hypothetical protein
MDVKLDLLPLEKKKGTECVQEHVVRIFGPTTGVQENGENSPMYNSICDI